MKASFKWIFITTAVCLLLFTGLSGQLPVKKLLPAPIQVSPADNSHFTHYPRKLTVRWQPVKAAVSYEVEIDCYHCRKTGQWDSQNGPAWKTDKVKNTAYAFVFPGDNKGRWRVRATRGRQRSAWSPWWHFDFKTSAAGSSGTAGKLPDLRVRDIRLKKDCQIQVTIQNIGAVGVPDSYYNLPNAVGVQMYKDSKPWGGLILKGFDPAGQLKVPGSTVQYTWFPAAANLKLGPGTHSIKVVVDHGNVLTEADETNNSMTKQLTCNGGLSLKPGAVIGTKPPILAKAPQRFFLDFKNAYLAYTKSTKSIQVIAESNVLSYGNDWQKCQVNPNLFHIRQNIWKGFYWEIDTAKKTVYRVNGGSFCKGGGSKQKLNMTVNLSGDLFYIYFNSSYLAYVPSSQTLQVAADLIVLSYGGDWQKCSLTPTIYHLRENFWKDFYWKIDTTAKKVWRVNGGTFCKDGGSETPLNIGVRVVN